MFFSPTFINHAYYENRSNSLADHRQGGSNQACQSEGVQSLPLRQDREGQKSLPEVLGHRRKPAEPNFAMIFYSSPPRFLIIQNNLLTRVVKPASCAYQPRHPICKGLCLLLYGWPRLKTEVNPVMLSHSAIWHIIGPWLVFMASCSHANKDHLNSLATLKEVAHIALYE